MANFQTLIGWIEANPGKAILSILAVWVLFTYGQSFTNGFIDGLWASYR